MPLPHLSLEAIPASSTSRLNSRTAGFIVNAPILMLMAALSADPTPTKWSTIYNPSPALAAAIRGQTPDYDPAVTPSAPPGGNYVAPAPAAPTYIQDPLMGQPMLGGYDILTDSSLGFGAVGPQPYKFGWTSRYDVGWIPQQSTSNGLGNFGVFEANGAWRYANPLLTPNMILAWTPEFNYRGWSGPDLVDLPAHVYRFASDIELSTPANAPWSIQLGFTPALVTDFSSRPNGDAFNWDGRGVLFYRASPQWMFAFGAAYWDRVNQYIIPYAGVVWTPSDQFELRLMFPKARASYLLGNNLWGGGVWLYGAVEYNVEAYQIGLVSPSGENERIELADYRAVIGLRSEGQGVTGFIEGGWVFAREVNFAHGTPDFDVGSGFIGRLGIRF